MEASGELQLPVDLPPTPNGQRSNSRSGCFGEETNLWC